MRRGYEQPVSPYVPRYYGTGNVETGNQGTTLANPRAPQRGTITSRIQVFSSYNPQGEQQSYDAHRAPAVNDTAMAQPTSTPSVTIGRAPDCRQSRPAAYESSQIVEAREPSSQKPSATRRQPTQPPEETRASATPTNKFPLAGTISDRRQPQSTPSQPSQPTTTRCSSLPKLPLTPPQELNKP